MHASGSGTQALPFAAVRGRHMETIDERFERVLGRGVVSQARHQDQREGLGTRPFRHLQPRRKSRVSLLSTSVRSYDVAACPAVAIREYECAGREHCQWQRVDRMCRLRCPAARGGLLGLTCSDGLLQCARGGLRRSFVGGWVRWCCNPQRVSESGCQPRRGRHMGAYSVHAATSRSFAISGRRLCGDLCFTPPPFDLQARPACLPRNAEKLRSHQWPTFQTHPHHPHKWEEEEMTKGQEKRR